MKFEVKYFFIYQLPEDLGMRKILAHGIRMQKNPQTRDKIFQSKFQLSPAHRNFIHGIANPEIVYLQFVLPILSSILLI